MEQVIARILARHGYTLNASTFAEFGDGEWVVWVKRQETDESCDDDYVAIGKDERFVLLESVQQLRGWLETHS